jgi:relaxase/mobilisation nuclease domain
VGVPPVAPAAEQPPKPVPTPPRQTEKIRTEPRGLSPQPHPAQPTPRGIGESLFRAAGDLLGQITEDGPMSQEEFEAMRRNLSRKRKPRRKRTISR